MPTEDRQPRNWKYNAKAYHRLGTILGIVTQQDFAMLTLANLGADLVLVDHFLVASVVCIDLVCHPYIFCRVVHSIWGVHIWIRTGSHVEWIRMCSEPGGARSTGLKCGAEGMRATL